MTSYQCEEYRRLAETAVVNAGLELITVLPDDDYIEAFCPKCNKISVFRRRELNRVCCPHCNSEKEEEDFYSRCETLVEAAGFTFVDASFEEDYIEIECDICDEITLLHAKDLYNIHCHFCDMRRVAERNGFIYCREDDAYGKPWETLMEECKKDAAYDQPVVLICRKCGELYLFEESSRDAYEDIKGLKCVCSTEIKEIHYQRTYKEGEWPYNFLFDVTSAEGQWIRPFEKIPADFEGTLDYVLWCLHDERSREILRLRYEEKQTLEAIGKHMNLTRERVRQVIAGLLEELRTPHWIRYLRYGIKELVRRERAVGVKLGVHNAEKPDSYGEPRYDLVHFNVAELIRIEDLGVNSWIPVCLRNANIHTVAELLSLDYLQLIKISKLSNSNVRDLVSALERLGFDCNHLTARSFYI